MSSRRARLASVQARSDTHPGLWLAGWIPSLDRNDTDRIRTHLGTLLDRVRVPEGYGAAFARRRRALASLAGRGEVARLYRVSCAGRVVSGMGIATVLENGLSLDRTWGMPILPGSSLKGVTRAFAGRNGGADWAGDSDAFEELFGSTERSGLVMFHDAWWEPPENGDRLPFSMDVLNPHHGQWNAALGMDPEGAEPDSGPMDWDAPVPVNFLAATGRFVTALVGPEAWVAAAEELLGLALEEDGVGSKTGAGYGRAALERLLSEADAALEALAYRTTEVVKGHQNNAPGTVAADIDQLIELIREASADPHIGPEAASARVFGIAERLWLEDRKTLEKWARSSSRTDEQREFVSALKKRATAQRPPQPPVPVTPTTVESKAESPLPAPSAEESWVPGVARLNRGKILAKVPGQPLKPKPPANLKDLGSSDNDLVDEICANPDEDWEVLVYSKNAKLIGLKRRER